MATPPEIVNLSKQYIAEKVIPLLTPEIGAVCLEIISWHIRVHTYQYAVFSYTLLSDPDFEAIDTSVDELALALPPREGEPWQSTLACHRCDPSEKLHYDGEVIYERWKEL